MPCPTRSRRSEEREHSYLFFAHTLAVNDFLIATELLCRSYPEIALQRVLHERVLKRTPFYVEDEDGTRLAVIPDAYVDLVVANPYQLCLSVEIDRGSEEQKAWRRKVRALVAYAEGPYIGAFGTDALTVAVVATPGAARLANLRQWAQDELDRRGQRQNADLFRFATFDPATATPEEIYLAPIWHIPFQAHAVALVETV